MNIFDYCVGEMILVTLSLVVLLAASLWWYNRRKLSYWADRGVSSPPAKPFLGHLLDIASTKRGRWVFDNEVHRNYTTNGVAGVYMFLSPVLHVSDPELIRQIFIKDFEHFSDRRFLKSQNKSDKVMNDILSNENGEKWKYLRSVLSPTFTTGKMKNMFHLVCDKADALVTFSLKEAAEKSKGDMKNNFGRFTMDTIASCAFGLECNSLENEDAEFPKKAQPFFDFGFMRLLKFVLHGMAPSIFSLLGIRLFPKETLFFKEVAEVTLSARRKGIKRGDFLDLLLEAQNAEDQFGSHENISLEDDTIIAQCVSFIIAGYDTTATTLAFASYNLSKNQDAQQYLRKELQEIIEIHGELTYQGIMEAKYLEGCLLETLRLFPPAPILERICSKDFKFPGTDLTVKKGQVVNVPVWAIHHDEKYWPEPEAFKPERFLPENKSNITNYTHMPFGLGPRNCLGMRFALMEAKVALAKMVLASELQLAPGHEELDLTPGAGLVKPNNLYLCLQPLREEETTNNCRGQ